VLKPFETAIQQARINHGSFRQRMGRMGRMGGFLARRPASAYTDAGTTQAVPIQWEIP